MSSEQEVFRRQHESRQTYGGPLVEKNGKVSIVILSCKRFNLLRRTCKALFDHIDRHEKDLDIEYILVDNGTRRGLSKWAEEQCFDKLILNPRNLGLAKGTNQGFQAATGEYIFQLQDDKLCDTSYPFIQMSLEVLREYEDIGIVRLKQEELQRGTKMRNIGSTRLTSSGIKFDFWLPTKAPCGVFCFGGSIFKRQAYLYTGPIKSFLPKPERSITEWTYAREFEKYYCAARIQGLLEVLISIGKHPCAGWNNNGGNPR